MATTAHPSYSYGHDMSDSPSNIPSLTPASTLGSNYDTSSPSQYHACDDVLEDAVFPELKNNEESDVQELQKDDPIGIDMWKFYRKQSNVPDAERMQNMTWRMMAINLRKVQQKRESSHVRAPAAEHWSPTTARQVQTTTTARRTSTQQRKIAIPRKGSVGKASWTAPPPGDRMDGIKFEDPSTTYQFDFTPPDHQLSQHHPAHFQTPSAYSLLNGPRGKIQVPDGFKQEPDAPGTHTRHVSLGGAGYSDSSPFGIKSDFTHSQHAPGGSNVTPWDPGWAEEAFGGQSLYDAVAPEVKQEEIEPSSFDLFPENWITGQDATNPQGLIGSQASVLNQHATAQSLSQWQQFEDSHFAELSGRKPQFRTQPGQYGQMFTTSAFDLGGSNINANSSMEPQAGYWGHASSSETTGRKRRKGR